MRTSLGSQGGAKFLSRRWALYFMEMKRGGAIGHIPATVQEWEAEAVRNEMPLNKEKKLTKLEVRACTKLRRMVRSLLQAQKSKCRKRCRWRGTWKGFVWGMALQKDRSIWKVDQTPGENSGAGHRFGNHPPERWWLNWYDKLSLPKEAGGSFGLNFQQCYEFPDTQSFSFNIFYGKKDQILHCFTIFKFYTHDFI